MNKIRYIAEAYREAIEYTLTMAEFPYDAIDFLSYWNEGCWKEIYHEFPDFNLNSEAQKWLIEGSGGV